MKRLKVLSNSASSAKSLSESRYLFHLWRSFDLSSAIFSILGMIFSTIDYEFSYSRTRSFKNCEIIKSPSESLRFLTSITTFLSIICLILRYHEKIKWKKKIFTIPDHDSLVSGKTKNLLLMVLEIIILSIFPYPYIETKVFIPLRHNFTVIEVCYNLSEILYCIMFLRFFLILRAFVNFSRFQNERGLDSCEEFNVKPNLRYLMKCLVMLHPIVFIVSIAIVSLFILALTCRIFERPIDDLNHLYFENPMTAIWFMLETMTTLGFGDYYPVTYPSRIISVVGYCVGSVIFTLMIVSLQKNVNLNRKEKTAFRYFIKVPYAVKIITSCIKFYLAKKKLGPNHPITILNYLKMKKFINDFKITKEKTYEKTDKNIKDLKKNVKLIEVQVKTISKIVSNILDIEMQI